MKRCRGEGAHPHARKGGGDVQRAKLVPCLSAPGADGNSLPRAAWPRQVPGGGEAAEGGAPATSGPCLTLFAASPRPAARQPAAALRGPKSEWRGAAGTPSCREAPAPHLRTPCSLRSLRAVLAQAASADPNPNAAPLISKSQRSRLPWSRS